MVIIFCGVPGSGKSTIAKKLKNELEKLGTVKLIISDQIPAQRYKRISRLLRENLDRADYILIDGTFYKKEWRDEVEEISGKENTFTIFCHCSLKTCLERNKERKPSVSEKAIHIINAEMEKPDKPDILINTEEIKPEEAVSQILNKIAERKLIEWQ